MADATKTLQLIVMLKEEMAGGISAIGDKLQGVQQSAEKLGGGIQSAVGGGFSKIGSMASGVMTGIGGAFQSGFSRIQSGMGKVNEGFGQMQGSAMKLMGLMAGGMIGGAELQMVKLAGTASRLKKELGEMGVDGEAALVKLRSATRNTIPDIDLLKMTNKAMALGLTKDTDKMGDLFMLARSKAKTFGMTVEETMNMFTMAAGKGRDAMLSQIGMQIDTKSAMDDYAKSIGKTATQLTEAEKTQAEFNAILKAGSKDIEKMKTANDGAGDKIAQLGVKMENFKLTIGAALTGPVNFLLDRLTELSNFFSNIPAPIQNAIIMFVGIGAVLAPLAIGISGLVGMFLGIGTVLAGLGGILSGVFLTPILLIVAAIGILALAWTQNWGGIHEKMAAVATWFTTVAWPALQSFFNQLVNVITTQVVPVVMDMLPTIQSIFEGVMSVVMTVGTFIYNFIKDNWDTISAVFKVALDFIGTAVKSVFTVIQGVIQVIDGVIHGDISKVWEGIKNIFGGALSFIVNSVTLNLRLVLALFGTNMGELWDKVSTTFNSIKDTAVNAVSSMVTGIMGFMTSLPGKVWGVISSIPDKLAAAFTFTIPHIKLPHISISGGFSLNPPSVPSVGISWYHSGGIVQGGYKQDVPAMLQAGEEVLTRQDPRHHDNMQQGGNSTTINVNITGNTIDSQGRVDQLVKQAVEALKRELVMTKRGVAV
ncbi:MAG: hypothetical protein WCP97_00515 [bacterium]